MSFISVIIPSYNGSKTIPYTILNVLGQEYPKERFELIIIEDGSKDDTMGIIKEIQNQFQGWNFTIAKNDGKGACQARNTAIRLAKGDIIAMTDQDTHPPQNWLSEIAKAMESPEVAGIYGDIATDFDRFIEPLNTTSVGKYLTANCAYRKDWLERVGLFSPEFPFGRGDSELAYKIIEAGGRIDHASDVIMYHPLRRFGRKEIKKTFNEAEFDILLVKKHPKLAKTDVLKQPIPGVTYEGLALISYLVGSAIFGLWFALGIPLFLIGFLSMARTTYKGKPWQDRILASVLTLVVSTMAVAGRIFASLKFRKFLV